MNFKAKIIFMTLFLFVFVNLTGCESVARKFVRKSKKEKKPNADMILSPEEYTGPNLSKEEFYREQFVLWQNWHDELIQALTYGTNHKKQLDCMDETIKYLSVLKDLIKEEKQELINRYLAQLKSLERDIQDDLYGFDKSSLGIKAERLKKNIMRDYSYHSVEGYLK